MKSFSIIALMASLSFGQETQDEVREPEYDEFPDEWYKDTCEAQPIDDFTIKASISEEQCRSTITDHSIEEVARYNDALAADYNRCMNDIYCRPRRAYCRMQYNPAYPTTFPSGFMTLW